MGREEIEAAGSAGNSLYLLLCTCGIEFGVTEYWRRCCLVKLWSDDELHLLSSLLLNEQQKTSGTWKSKQW